MVGIRLLMTTDPPFDATAALQRLRLAFAAIPDRRQPGKIDHRLDEILAGSLCSMLCGFGYFTSIAEFFCLQIDWLRGFLPLEKGPPSHDVIRNAFMAVKPEALVEILTVWVGDLDGTHVAIDGKVQRSALCAGGAVHVLRAWVNELSLSAGQAACAAKSNEIEAIPRLLDSLQLKGATVTIDAAGCQTAIAAQIDDGGGAYVLALKANQPQALAAVSAHFDSNPAGLDRHATEERSRGRYEKREYSIQSDLSWFGKSWKWQGLKSVGHVRRTTVRPGGSGADGREALVEDSYFLCSIEADAKRFAELARGHWGVENRCHWTLDVTFGEDLCGTRDATASRNLSTLREMAIGLLRAHPSKKTLPLKQLQATLDPDFRLRLLANFHA